MGTVQPVQVLGSSLCCKLQAGKVQLPLVLHLGLKLSLKAWKSEHPFEAGQATVSALHPPRPKLVNFHSLLISEAILPCGNMHAAVC